MSRSWPSRGPASGPLLTDLYQLTMLDGYVSRGMHATAVFEFFVRRLPETRSFLVASGIESVLDYLAALRFDDDDMQWLRESGRFSASLLDYLERFRFDGDVYAVPEGTPVFANEPLVRVVAELPQAQLVESRIVNLMNYQTMIATKAARCVLAAPDKTLVDFGMRRAHGAEAALMAARASYVAGFDGTATVLANRLFDIPVFGTMAHSYIEAHDSEIEAFAGFARAQPDNAVLLIDTYDTVRGARRIVEIAPALGEEGIAIRGVRLDSGDLAALAREVRAVLDEGGLGEVEIFASGGLDEHELERLTAAGAPIDGFGIGTDLDVSTDAPYLDCVYKLQEYDGRARRKRSTGKATWPGRKQIYRSYREDGSVDGDVVGLEDEFPEREGLLRPVMRAGKRLVTAPSIDDVRARTQQALGTLPPPLRSIGRRADYPVEISAGVRALAERIDSEARDPARRQ